MKNILQVKEISVLVSANKKLYRFFWNAKAEVALIGRGKWRLGVGPVEERLSVGSVSTFELCQIKSCEESDVE